MQTVRVLRSLTRMYSLSAGVPENGDVAILSRFIYTLLSITQLYLLFPLRATYFIPVSSSLRWSERSSDQSLGVSARVQYCDGLPYLHLSLLPRTSGAPLYTQLRHVCMFCGLVYATSMLTSSELGPPLPFSFTPSFSWPTTNLDEDKKTLQCSFGAVSNELQHLEEALRRLWCVFRLVSPFS